MLFAVAFLRQTFLIFSLLLVPSSEVRTQSRDLRLSLDRGPRLLNVLKLRGGGAKRQRSNSPQSCRPVHCMQSSGFGDTEILDDCLVLPDCISLELSDEIQLELATLNFSFLTNDCAQGFRVVRSADGIWGDSDDLSAQLSQHPALDRLLQRLTEVLNVQHKPPKVGVKRARQNGTDTQAFPESEHGEATVGPGANGESRSSETVGGTGDEELGNLGEVEVVVMRKWCYRLCCRGGDFFGRTPAHSQVLYDIHPFPEHGIWQRRTSLVLN